MISYRYFTGNILLSQCTIKKCYKFRQLYTWQTVEKRVSLSLTVWFQRGNWRRRFFAPNFSDMRKQKSWRNEEVHRQYPQGVLLRIKWTVKPLREVWNDKRNVQERGIQEKRKRQRKIPLSKNNWRSYTGADFPGSKLLCKRRYHW